MRFKDKCCIITGGASGIGAAAARRFHAEGAKVLIADLNNELGKNLVNELGSERALYLPTDVSDFAAVNAMIDKAVDTFGTVDILFNNAGIGCFGETPDLDIAEWQRVIAIDLTAVFYGCKAAIPVMRKNGGGAIINTASASGLGGDYAFTAYNAAKGGVVNYTRAAAIDHAAEGIRINAVCPGPVSTPIVAGIEQLAGAKQVWERSVPIGRFAAAEEIAATVAFLASDDASYIIGAAIPVDGGLTAHTGQPSLKSLMANAGVQDLS